MFRKSELIDAIATKNRGLFATPTDRVAIQRAIARLEDCNPTPNPLESPDLQGIWRLLYTTSTELLGIDRLPLYRLGQIYQCIDTEAQRIYNLAEVEGPPLLEGLVSVSATFTPVSRQRVTVGFERGVFGLQRALGYENPRQFIQKLQAQAKLPLWQGIDFRINRDRQSGWLEVTYLDPTLRIGRGNEGNLFVLQKAA
ncbi:MAG: PAP/fibrillin family protein [Leptolyngbyaceae cyanobacterium T60_A2020_046]|nr:PAP/fibrillin family protein [Leptolyngbyaceae cyanobacterium T60_A2020_046]